MKLGALKSVSSPVADAPAGTRAVDEARRWLAGELRGQTEAIDLCLCALIAGGHALVEGVPGIGKTKLARALAALIGGRFSRVQMTSDLLPGEVIGGLRPSADGSRFEFHRGPVFSNVLLVDELNRGSPRTQAALLEAMAEGQATVDGESHALPEPFAVLATQNPEESQGVYALPESQLDRFMMYVAMGYPGREDELAVYRRVAAARENAAAPPRLDLMALREAAGAVHVDDAILEYVYLIIDATRKHAGLRAGVSVRGGEQLLAAARGWALMAGRDFTTPADVKAVAGPVLAHRLKTAQEDAPMDAKRRLMAEILESVPCPR